jgi:hypothetical protein
MAWPPFQPYYPPYTPFISTTGTGVVPLTVGAGVFPLTVGQGVAPLTFDQFTPEPLPSASGRY